MAEPAQRKIQYEDCKCGQKIYWDLPPWGGNTPVPFWPFEVFGKIKPHFCRICGAGGIDDPGCGKRIMQVEGPDVDDKGNPIDIFVLANGKGRRQHLCEKWRDHLGKPKRKGWKAKPFKWKNPTPEEIEEYNKQRAAALAAVTKTITSPDPNPIPTTNTKQEVLKIESEPEPEPVADYEWPVETDNLFSALERHNKKEDKDKDKDKEK